MCTQPPVKMTNITTPSTEPCQQCGTLVRVIPFGYGFIGVCSGCGKIINRDGCGVKG